MDEHIFPESTTYIHSYRAPPGHERWYDLKLYKTPENSLFEYKPPSFVPKNVIACPPKSQEEINKELLPQSGGQLKKPSDKPSSLCSVIIRDLDDDDKALLLANTYRTTYGDYSKTISSPKSLPSTYRAPYSSIDDKMLQTLNSTKPDLFHYGFGLPNKCCEAWGKVQLRAVPQKRQREPAKRQCDNPYPGYPHKMDPLIEARELDPHYDGSFNFGYTGFQKSYLIDYPEDVNRLRKKNFPEIIPQNVTTNEANLVYKTIPLCQSEENKLLEKYSCSF